jgi:SH3-like domain-containing protein
MKKILVLLALFAFSASAWAEEMMVNVKDAKIRSGPGKTYPVLWKPHLYTPLEILAKYHDWYAVMDVARDVGWVHDESVSKDKGAIVVEKIIDVRESADSKSRVLYQAPKDFTFKISEEEENWVKVTDSEGDSGWIQKKAVWTGGVVEEKAHKKEAKKEGKKSKKSTKTAKGHKSEKKKSE